MFARLLLLFIFVPIIELMILIDLGGYLGTVPTIILVVGTGALGAYLAKKEGFRIFFTIRHKLQTGQLPADELLDGLIILIAGALLITPGLITDLFGFLMLFRPSRSRFKIWLKIKFSAHINIYNANTPT
ncbi:FxsA family protein [candidate division KSB1 bacterium]|nr:FxsA family protein [candidate division KSB1 bacterium]